MTTIIGSQQDMFNRLKANLVNWFGSDTPVLDALLMGCAETDAYIYSLIVDSNLQTRVHTATGIYLDYISQDFFGDNLPRHPGETDDSFRNRILANLVQERATRAAMIQVLQNLTWFAPGVIEGFNTFDAGAYDTLDPGGGLYYDNWKGYGWLEPYTAIIIVHIPEPSAPFFSVGGYDQPDNPSPGHYGGFGYDFNFNNAYVSLTQINPVVSVQDVLQVIQATKVFGTKMYVYIYQGNTLVYSPS